MGPDRCVVCGSPLPHSGLKRVRHSVFWTIGVLLGHLVDVTEDW